MELLKKIVLPYRVAYLQNQNRKKFIKSIRQDKDLKIVVGSAGSHQSGWIPTERYFLDLLKEEEWAIYFKENAISNILAEHVWEHLTLEEGKKAAEICYKFLKISGNLRIAVPDGFHTNKDYIDYVKVGGSGAGAHDHKVLYNYKQLSNLLCSVGFKTNIVEYFDESGVFHAIDWDGHNGHVNRSIRYDKRNFDKKPNYTSLIIDAIK